MVAASELPINEFASAMNMARTIFGDGTRVISASYTGDRNSSGTYSNGDSVSPDTTPGDTGVILSTGRTGDFTNTWGQANQDTGTSSNTSGVNNDAGFNAAAGTNTYDAAWMDVVFIPTGNFMTMQFVFASEEYPEYTNSTFQDMVGVWINGTLVPLGVGDGDTSPGNINPNENTNLYIDNTSDQYNTEMDGFTVTLSLKIPVISGQQNTIRIGIADVADSNYDSSILIAAGSVQTALVAFDDADSTSLLGSVTTDVLGNDTPGSLSITHINNIAVSPGQSVTLPTGQTVTLNPDGTLTTTGDGDEEEISYTYTVDDGTNTDTAFVTIDFVPCFVAGTLVETPNGPRPVEALVEGDLVLTRDDGPQPLRWIGQRRVTATGNLAPIRIAENTFGRHGEVWVSPMHRILIRDVLADLLFGESEVLVAAKHLVNGNSVQQIDCAQITYVHLLFDSHQVVNTMGLDSESFLPGPQSTSSFERETVDEICALFPELDPHTGSGYSPAARRTLRGYEARLLVTSGLEHAA